MHKKVARNMRLTPETLQLLKALSEKLHINQTSIVELAVSKLAEMEKIQIEVEKE